MTPQTSAVTSPSPLPGTPPSAETEPLVRARDLFKIYREANTETVALRGASLELARGQITSLVGPSGSGKSTLLALLAGLALPTAGQVIFNGEDITRLDEAERSRRRAREIGVVFQRDNLIPFLTAAENVKLAIKLARGRGARRRAKTLLDQLGLGARLRHFPRQLSGGETQRVAIAVALANEPTLLLADELTGELDSKTTEQVLEVVTHACVQRRLTVLVVTHNPRVAAHAHRQLRLVDGIVVDA